jgi:biotin carboxyl carrier protein
MTRHAVIGGVSATLTVEDAQFKLVREDGQSLEGTFSCVEIAPGTFSIILNGCAHRVHVAAGETLVDGKRVEVEVFDPRDRRTAGKASSAHGARQILAPMPGKIVRLLVDVGDEVTEGQGLVVVEAMKMQNEMKSPKAGRVAEVRTQADATVTAGQILVVIE